MIVSEFEDLLAYLPEDLGVCIRGGSACKHITRVSKKPAWRLHRPDISQAMDHALHATTVLLPSGSHPPMLVLEADYSAPLWCHAWAEDVEFTVDGRWPSKMVRRRA